MNTSQIKSLLLFGALWGAVEATLGYALHLLRRIVLLPNLPGFILFPVGLLIMVAAVRATGLRWAPLGVAVVAATTKVATVALPAVAPAFVVNPSLAILAEGAVVAAGAYIFAFSRSPRILGETFVVAVGWRVLFLGLLFVLPVRGGILRKGPEALIFFVLGESIVNAAVAFGATYVGLSVTRLKELVSRMALPALGAATVPLALVAAVGLQLVAAVL